MFFFLKFKIDQNNLSNFISLNCTSFFDAFILNIPERRAVRNILHLPSFNSVLSLNHSTLLLLGSRFHSNKVFPMEFVPFEAKILLHKSKQVTNLNNKTAVLLAPLLKKALYHSPSL